MTFEEFARQAFSVIRAIQDDLFAHPPTEEIPPPADWAHLMAIIREHAEDIILCTDVRQAVVKLRGDRSAQMGVVTLISDVLPDDQIKIVLRRAYDSTPHEQSLLPAVPFASFLLEICKGIDLGSIRPEIE